MDEDNLYDYNNGVGCRLEIFEVDDGIGIFMARRDECISLELPHDEAWSLVGSLAEALR